MRQRAFQLTEAQACELQGAYHNCPDAQTRTRYQAVRLYGQGYPTHEIESICGCSRSSLMEWCRSYREAGVTGLVDQRIGGNRALLMPHQLERLQYLLDSYAPSQLFGAAACVGSGQFWTVGDLAQLVQREFAVSYKSETSLRELLAKCGFSYQRPAKQYKSRSVLKVAEFEEQLEKN
jgi:transposase